MMRDKVIPVAWLFLASVIIGLSVGFFARPDVHTGGAVVVPVAPTPAQHHPSLTVPQGQDFGAIGGEVR